MGISDGKPGKDAAGGSLREGTELWKMFPQFEVAGCKELPAAGDAWGSFSLLTEGVCGQGAMEWEAGDQLGSGQVVVVAGTL